jgi:hypothetical protein
LPQLQSTLCIHAIVYPSNENLHKDKFQNIEEYFTSSNSILFKDLINNKVECQYRLLHYMLLMATKYDSETTYKHISLAVEKVFNAYLATHLICHCNDVNVTKENTNIESLIAKNC